MLLETLVKLAALGTSGICIFAIFWAGRLIEKTSDTGKLKTVRFFIGAAVAIALVSAASGVLNALINAGTIKRLEAENQATSIQLSEEKRQSQRLISDLAAKQDTLRLVLDNLGPLIRSPSVAAAARSSPILRERVRKLETVVPPR